MRFVGRSLWDRMRIQLGGAVLAVLLPAALRYPSEATGDLASLGNSFIGSFVALVVGYFAFNRIVRYPGVRPAYHIIPVFAVTFSAVLITFLFLRQDYSRLQFASSYFLTVIWYYVVYFKLQRQRLLTFAVVPFGSANELTSLPDINWIVLHEPRLPPVACDAVVADLRADLLPEWESFLAAQALEGRLVMHVKQVAESLTGRVEIEHLSENTFGSLAPGLVYGRLKWAIDVAAALLALPLLLPILMIIALVVRLDTRGPALFSQQRMGYRRKPFIIYKFRTMRWPDLGTPDGRSGAITRSNDARITRVGRFLRRYRLDELPQVLNILKGDMSWIGPRPEAVALSHWYESELPFYRYRHIVRPGLTGWAQVKQGHVAEVDEVLSKLHFDFYYIKNFSVWLDVLIVAGTIRIIVSGFGSR